MRTYKGQPFEPTVTPRRRKPKPKPLKLRTAPNRDKLLRPQGKRPARVLPPTGRRGPNRAGRNAGRNGAPAPAPAAPPVDPFKAEVNAILDLKYGDELAAFKAEGPVSAQQHTNIQGWYQGYLDDLQTAAQMTSQMYGGAQAATYGQANTAASQDQARMGENQQQAQASAALRGTSASVQPEQAAAIGARQASTTNFGSFLAAQGGAAATLDAGRYSAAGAARVGAHEQEAAKAVEAREEMRKLLAERGAEKVTLRRQLEDEAFKRQLLAQEFGLKTRAQKLAEKKARQDARQKKREHRLDRLDTIADNRRLTASERRQRAALRETIRANLEREGQDRAEEQGRNLRDNGSGGSGPSNLTPTQRRGYQQDFSQAAATLRSAYGYKSGKFTIKDKGKTYTYTLDEMATIIVRDMNVPPEIAKAAVYTVAGRPVPPPLVKKVRRLGVRVPRGRRVQPRSPGDIVGGVFDDVAGR